MDNREPLCMLSNGLALFVVDRSNRYFGDYHRIHLTVVCDVPVVAEWLSDSLDPAQEAARIAAQVGQSVRFEKLLERMAVPGAEVADVRRQMLADYLASARPYLDTPEFPGRLLRQRCLTQAKRLSRDVRINR